MLSGVSSKFTVMNRNDQLLLATHKKYSLPYHFILYLGTIEPRKNIKAIIRAFSLLQSEGNHELEKYSLVIAGASGWRAHEVLQEINQSSCRDKIVMTQFVADEDKSALYNLASLFVYPSIFEGFGLPPVEAMSCGVPVIVSNNSCFPEVIGDAGILIDPYQPEEIYQAMRAVLLDKDLHGMLSARGLKRCKELNWQKAAQDMLRHFKG